MNIKVLSKKKKHGYVNVMKGKLDTNAKINVVTDFGHLRNKVVIMIVPLKVNNHRQILLLECVNHFFLLLI